VSRDVLIYETEDNIRTVRVIPEEREAFGEKHFSLFCFLRRILFLENKKKKMYRLVSSDDKVFEISPEVAKLSPTIIEGAKDRSFSLHFPGKILRKVVEYCEHYVEDSKTFGADSIPEWYKNFCNVDQATLFELILIANYLDIKPLLDLTCMTVANLIKKKTPEEIRKTFNISHDFTPEEEEQVRKEYEWCDEEEGKK
jgi:S-phase kinase-associated protein 1